MKTLPRTILGKSKGVFRHECTNNVMVSKILGLMKLKFEIKIFRFSNLKDISEEIFRNETNIM